MATEVKFHNSVRPESLVEFIGQEGVVGQVEAMIGGARRRGEPLGHLLLTGPKGLGKTSMARCIAAELGGELVEVDGHSLTSPADAIALLLSVPAGGFLFLDEIHRLSRPVQEALLKPLEDFEAYISDGSGGTRAVKMAPFTCIGATTSSGRIISPLKERFGAELSYDWYSDDELAEIGRRAAAKLGMELEPEALLELAGHGRGTPRQVINLLKRIRDYKADELPVNRTEVAMALTAMSIGKLGLGLKDRAYLETLAARDGSPVGVKALAAMLFEDAVTLEFEIEPFLLGQGLIDLGVNGRVLTAEGAAYLK